MASRTRSVRTCGANCLDAPKLAPILQRPIDATEMILRRLASERALSLGAEEDTKTTAQRTVRLLAPLRSDLATWRLASGRQPEAALVFTSQTGESWTEPAYQSWRRRSFKRALDAAGVTKATPYTLRPAPWVRSSAGGAPMDAEGQLRLF